MEAGGVVPFEEVDARIRKRLGMPRGHDAPCRLYAKLTIPRKMNSWPARSAGISGRRNRNRRTTSAVSSEQVSGPTHATDQPLPPHSGPLPLRKTTGGEGTPSRSPSRETGRLDAALDVNLRTSGASFQRAVRHAVAPHLPTVRPH
jgi:hypothetical protein